MFRKSLCGLLVLALCLTLLVGVATTAVADEYEKSYNVSWGSWTPSGVPFEERYWALMIQEKFNINLTFIPLDGDRENLAWNTGEIPDLQNAWMDKVQTYNDLLVDLTEWWEEGKVPNAIAVMDRYPSEAWKIQTPDGRYFFMPTIVTNNLPMIGWTYNQTALNDAGVMEMPDTFDELYDALKMYKEANPDSYPLVGGGESFNQTVSFGGFLGYATSWGVLYNPVNDSWESQFLPQHHMKEAVEYFKKLYDEGLVHPEYLTMTGDEMIQSMVNRVSVVIPFWWNTPWGPDGNFEVSDFTDQLVGMPPPAGPTGLRHTSAYPGHVVGNGCVVSQAVLREDGKLDRIMEMLDWIYSDEGVAATNWGEEGVTFVINDLGYKVYTEDFLYARNNPDSLDKPFDASFYGDHTNMMTDNWLGTARPAFLDVLARINKIPNSEYFRDYNMPPLNYSEDEQLDVNRWRTAVNDYWGSQVHQIILGKVSLDDWDAMVDYINSLGLEELVAMNNKVYDVWKTTDAYQLFKAGQ